jgi:hypothetical protein
MKAGDFCNQNAGYGSMCARVGAYCPSCERMQTCAISEHSHFVNDRIALRCEECRHIWIISRFDDITPMAIVSRLCAVCGEAPGCGDHTRCQRVFADQYQDNPEPPKVKFREFT